MKDYSLKLKVYLVLIIILGLIFFVLGMRDFNSVNKYQVLIFIITGILIELLRIRLKNNMALSLSFAIGLATLFIYQSYIVSFIGFITVLLCVNRYEGKTYHIFNSDIYKRLFNASAYSISLGVATLPVYFTQNINLTILGLNPIFILLATLIYLIVNTIIFTILICLIENMSLKKGISYSLSVTTSFMLFTPLGVITALTYLYYGWVAILFFLGPIAIARYSFKLYLDLKNVYFETIKALSNTVEIKDKYTNGHSHRVAEYAESIAKELKLNKEIINKIRTAALLHDIGKIGISDSILNKPSSLTEEEFSLVKEHPVIGANLILDVDFLKEHAKIIKYHHERYDGKGYPEGLKGEEIPLEACIVALADAYDAMTTDRAYRKAMDKQTAQRIIINESGKQFHPKVVEGFFGYINKVYENGVKEELIESEKIIDVS